MPIPRREVLEGKWRLEKRLGSGGMGTVHLATELELDRKVAIKMLAPELAHEPEVVTRFEREARMLAQLEHPNLVPILSVGRSDGQPFIVMKYLEGGTLSEFLRKRGRLPLEEALSLMGQICAGLELIHSRGVVHRDLKPGNIIVSPDGHATLLDLGVAHDPRSQLTRAGVAIGTPRYMAPEQAMGKDRIDHRADIYAAGVLLYEMLTGVPVFEGESDHSVMRKHVNMAAPDAAIHVPDVPKAVSELLTKCLSKRPERRFQSVGELYAALEAAVEGQAPAAPPVRRKSTKSIPIAGSRPRTTPAPAPAPAPTPAPVRPQAQLTIFRGPNGERRVPKAFVGLCVGAVVLGAGLALLRPNDPQPVPLQIQDLSARDNEPLVVDLPPPEPPPAPEPTVTASNPPEQEPRAEQSDPVLPERRYPKGKAGRGPARSATQSERFRNGELRITTTLAGELSWAWIDVDGLRRGQTPIVLKLEVGKHDIRLARPGFSTITRQVEVTGDGPTKLSLELKK